MLQSNSPLFFFSLEHYIIQVRVVNGVPPTGDYSFAKYNKVRMETQLSSVWHISNGIFLFAFCCFTINWLCLSPFS